jgi:hypothetical protein
MISRRGGRPGLLGTVARTAVIAGTAQTTANAVNRRGQQRAAAAAPAPFPQAPPPPLPPPAPAAAEPREEVDLVAQLSRLAQLRDSGVLTEGEFQAAKTRILA